MKSMDKTSRLYASHILDAVSHVGQLSYMTTYDLKSKDTVSLSCTLPWA